ncbi:YdcF family protein [Streptococcus sp. zg-JUN1979]|uniref:YdcF family protein n=1 Tax=Streptococcus sp. zg-JUN1979 TaxID=3391450 RepID=UPI0039A5E60C
MTWIIPLSLGLIFALSFRRDPRNLWNSLLLLAFLSSSYLWLTRLAYEQSSSAYQLLSIPLLLLPLLMLGLGGFLIINGLIILKREGKSLGNSLSLLLGLAIFAYFIVASLSIHWGYELATRYVPLYYIFIFINVLVLALAFVFLAFLIYSLLYHLLPRRRDYDYIIIHGAGLLGGDKITPLLAKRIDKAIDAYHKASKTTVKLIASGGQGADETISEGEAIANYLRQKGIPKEDILLEDKSQTTYENLLFSKEMTKDHDKARYLFVTNDYHILRTSFYARKLQMTGDGLGCATASYYLPSAFIREYVAILQKLKLFFVIVFVIFVILLIISLQS